MDFNKLLDVKSGDVIDGLGDTVVLAQALVINCDDVAIKNLTVKGEILVKANNVTLENCKIDAVVVSGDAFVCQGNTVSSNISIKGTRLALSR